MRCVVIGTGNVAWSLAPAIAAAPGYELVEVAGRNIDRAREIADSIDGCRATTIDSVCRDADIYLIATVDDAIATLADSLPTVDGAIWFHTSGGVSAAALEPLGPDYGVVYPLQTFTRGMRVDMKRVPMFVEGSTPRAEQAALDICRAVSDNVRPANSAVRRRMHVAAVFACNFVNHLWDIADTLLRNDGMSIDLLTPLIDLTIEKARAIGPHASQTGPAVRGDSAVMAAHRATLPQHERDIYRMLSDSIADFHRNDQHPTGNEQN